MRRREFFKVVFAGTGAAVLPGQRSRVCRWAVDGCAPSDRNQYYTECGQDFLTLDKTRAQNDFAFCIYCGGRIEEVPLKTGELCGQIILDDLRREGAIG